MVVVVLLVDEEGTGTATEVTGTESVLEVTEIMTHGIIYYSLDEKCLQQEFSSVVSHVHNNAIQSIINFHSSFEIFL
jgi:hypothetical protein